MKIDTERVVQLAKMEDLMIAILMDRIRQLPKEQSQDLGELALLLSRSKSAEEREEILTAMREILHPSLIGDVVQGVMPKSAGKELEARTAHLGRKIRELRAMKSLTQEDLAELSGLPQSHISRLEAGKHSPSHATLEKIAGALGVKIDQIDYEDIPQ